MEVLLPVEGKGGWLSPSHVPPLMSNIPAAKNIIALDHIILAMFAGSMIWFVRDYERGNMLFVLQDSKRDGLFMRSVRNARTG
jgi:hypothetical protein